MPRITYFPKMSHSADDPTDHNGGRYVTISKDGIIQFWSMDFHPLRTHSVGSAGLYGRVDRVIDFWVFTDEFTND